ncbi:DUF4132 domain-containing protein [Nocardia sp. NPDC127526]|uniref:DUF4132 domain-containing protein n=1 Tax=Nocardia sp. NPDC127526 TaxID=3345393 RepID=UPI0036395E8D
MTLSEHRPASREELPGDEDVFEPTAAQRKQLLYRRDGLLRPPAPAVDADAVAVRAQACAEFYGQAIERLRTRDPRPVRVLSEAPGAIGELPMEVAAALLSTRIDVPSRATPAQRRQATADVAALLDHWWAVRGPVFAVEAALRAVTDPLWEASRYYPDSEYAMVRAALGGLRNRLASCPDEEMPAIIALLDGFRGVSRPARAAGSFLLPSQREWVSADIEEAVTAEDARACRLLVDAASTPAQLQRLNWVFHGWAPVEGVALCDGDSAIAVIDGAGFDTVAVFETWFDHWETGLPLRKAIAQALAVIPTDAAFLALAGRTGHPPAMVAVREAAKRFPRRALRLFDPARHTDLLREHLAGHLDLARSMAAELPSATVGLIEAEGRRAESAQGAAAVAPDLLRDPPWTTRIRTEPVVVEGLTPPPGVDVGWLPADPKDWRGLMAFGSPELVDQAVLWLDRRSYRAVALNYLRRHARFVAQRLIPRALGAAAKERRSAERVLRLLADHGYGDEIRGAAVEYGAPTAAAVDAMLGVDPLTLLPSRIPVVPDWINVTALPLVRTRDGAPLSETALHNLLVMLMLADVGRPYAGAARAGELCDPATLADLAWELFAQWQRSGAPARHDWVYEALEAYGNDDTVAALLEHVRANRSDRRSVTVLDAFVAIGSDAALLALKFISEKVKTTRVRQGARERIEAVADRMGLSADQLADRLVPDLGLRADGAIELDFGPRRFVVGFDEQLRPIIATADGQRVKTLPRPGAGDDAEQAALAHKTFAKLKKDARAIAADQIKRLERAMATNRRFTLDEVRNLFIAHPLRWHITRRLVWGVYHGETLERTFRVAEDRTFADSGDEALTLPADATLGLAHPVQFADEVPAWSELFADYELLQPFPQLDREIFTVPAELRGARSIPSDGTKIDSTRFLGLPGRGWSPIENTDGAHIMVFDKPLPRGGYLQVDAHPGLMAWDPRANPEQTFDAGLVPGPGSGGSHLTFADLDAVTASEVLRDIAWLKAGTL